MAPKLNMTPPSFLLLSSWILIQLEKDTPLSKAAVLSADNVDYGNENLN